MADGGAERTGANSARTEVLKPDEFPQSPNQTPAVAPSPDERTTESRAASDIATETPSPQTLFAPPKGAGGSTPGIAATPPVDTPQVVVAKEKRGWWDWTKEIAVPMLAAIVGALAVLFATSGQTDAQLSSAMAEKQLSTYSDFMSAENELTILFLQIKPSLSVTADYDPLDITAKIDAMSAAIKETDRLSKVVYLAGSDASIAIAKNLISNDLELKHTTYDWRDAAYPDPGLRKAPEFIDVGSKYADLLNARANLYESFAKQARSDVQTLYH